MVFKWSLTSFDDSSVNFFNNAECWFISYNLKFSQEWLAWFAGISRMFVQILEKFFACMNCWCYHFLTICKNWKPPFSKIKRYLVLFPCFVLNENIFGLTYVKIQFLTHTPCMWRCTKTAWSALQKLLENQVSLFVWKIVCLQQLLLTASSHFLDVWVLACIISELLTCHIRHHSTMFLPKQLKGEVRVNFMHLRGEIVKLDDKRLREFV